MANAIPAMSGTKDDQPEAKPAKEKKKVEEQKNIENTQGVSKKVLHDGTIIENY